jgi:hypothetical protein
MLHLECNKSLLNTESKYFAGTGGTQERVRDLCPNVQERNLLLELSVKCCQHSNSIVDNLFGLSEAAITINLFSGGHHYRYIKHKMCCS